MYSLPLNLDRPSIDLTLRILNYARSVLPILILVIFLAGFVVYGIKNAPDDGDKVRVHAMRGPGGRPLPVRRKSANQIKDAATVRDVSPSAKLAFRALQTGVLVTFLINAGAIIVQALAYRKHEWWPGQSAVVYVVASFFAWVVVAISLIDTKPSPTWVHQTTWAIALPVELLILACSLRIYSGPHNEPKVGDPQGGKHRRGPTGWEVTEVIVLLVRVGCLLAMIVLYLLYWHSTTKSTRASNALPSERESLLGANHMPNGNGHTYGVSEPPKPEHKPAQDAWAKPTETPNITWYAYLRGFVVLIPYLWPRKSVRLQCLALLCLLIMIAQRVVTVFVPILIGHIVDALSGDDGHNPRAPWLLISFYILCRWLQGGQGLLAAARTILWIPVEQYSYRAISTAAFEHVHGLSAEFHTGKRTGELISALNKGSAINSFLEMITFNVGPMIIDLIVAIVFLGIKFDVYLGLVVAIVTFAYVYVTIRLASWRVTLRRHYTNADREMEAVKNDSLHSWDTVKYFNAEAYEFQRYKLAIKAMQGFEYWVQVTLAYMNTIQGALFTVALLVACFIEAYQVATGLQTVGNFTSLITYMMQLQGPLNFFGTFYRAIQNNLINAERMLELFKEEPVVVDKASARDLDDCSGDIVFDNVTFGYDPRKPALKNLSFRCAPGTTTALVGESGGGKTTVMRLIFRYYNPETGEIRVDGTDVQDLTIDSLRSHIGVVPQDCNMFNESIMYNLRYANQNATDEEIFAACQAASIHDRIMMFPEGYETKVGERGVRLSGGERQRVAIARTILKNPKITLLDEATAALDTETEERIQQALKQLAIGRTMLIIAHRLSTITDADQILVLSGGTVVERGTHLELIEKGGKYASMWRKQSRAQRAAAEAEELRIKAKRALEAAEIDSANVSEDEADRASLRGDKSPGGYSGVAKRLVTGASSGSGSNRGVRGHKRVNFSHSSLGRTWGPPSDEDSSEDQHRDSDTPSNEKRKVGTSNDGKPPGHP